MRLLAEFTQEEIEGAMVHLKTRSRDKAVNWLKADLTDDEAIDWLRGEDWYPRLARELVNGDFEMVKKLIKRLRHCEAVMAENTQALDEMIRNTSRGSPYNLPPWSYYQL